MKNLNNSKTNPTYGRQDTKLRFTDKISLAFPPIHALRTLWQDHFKTRILQARKGVQRVLLQVLLPFQGGERRREKKIQEDERTAKVCKELKSKGITLDFLDGQNILLLRELVKISELKLHKLPKKGQDFAQFSWELRQHKHFIEKAKQIIKDTESGTERL